MDMKNYEDSENFRHIPDLKPGDKLKLTIPTGLEIPTIGDHVIVYKLLDFPDSEYASIREALQTGAPIKRCDFTAVFVSTDDNDVVEYPMDSRYFQRAEE
jgi:hypothetical protein